MNGTGFTQMQCPRCGYPFNNGTLPRCERCQWDLSKPVHVYQSDNSNPIYGFIDGLGIKDSNEKP